MLDQTFGRKMQLQCIDELSTRRPHTRAPQTSALQLTGLEQWAVLSCLFSLSPAPTYQQEDVDIQDC